MNHLTEKKYRWEFLYFHLKRVPIADIIANYNASDILQLPSIAAYCKKLLHSTIYNEA